MNWRGGIVLPGDYGEQHEALPIVGGGSTRQTLYYQQTWKRGEELKERQPTGAVWLTTQIYNTNDSVNWPPKAKSVIELQQGNSASRRAGKSVWGQRIQVDVHVHWATYEDTAVGAYPQGRPTVEKVFAALVRVKKSDGTGDPFAGVPKGWPRHGDVFGQGNTEMPMSKKNADIEILAWKLIEPEEKQYRDYIYPDTYTTAVAVPPPDDRTYPYQLNHYRRWEGHSVWTRFDISLKGSKFKYRAETDNNPIGNDIQLAIWKIHGGADVALANGAVFAEWVFSYSQEPPKRLWTPQAAGRRRGREDADDYEWEGKRAREEDMMEVLADALEEAEPPLKK